MTEQQILGLWQGCAVFLFACLVIVAAAVKLGPSEPDCDPSCNSCPAWRREQDAIKALAKPLPICPVCWKRHKPEDPHR